MPRTYQCIKCGRPDPIKSAEVNQVLKNLVKAKPKAAKPFISNPAVSFSFSVLFGPSSVPC